MQRNRTLAVSGVAIFILACGGGGGGGTVAPGTRSANEVTSARMAQTFAGKHKCDPKSADRPFVIEWDATDMSSFQARAANDVVFVRYEGCDLKIVDACADDSVKGSLGSYKPVDWTSGALQSLDVNDEGDLYAKLPLGVATLGGRVRGGERFHMEYFVSGTRSATREAVYRGDLAAVPACKDATHFVYAYNLGAFALGAQSSVTAAASGSAFGFGAGASRSSSSKAEKQGGVLASCSSASAKELETCKVPIRLTLREVQEGENAEAKAARAPETPQALNLAGRLQATTKRQQAAAGHLDAATTKMASGDGKGCLAELDLHDKLDPRPLGLSTNGKSGNAIWRSQCLMLAGHCDAGKALYRQFVEKIGAVEGPEQADGAADMLAGRYCRGAATSPRDRVLVAQRALTQGRMSKKTPRYCNEHIKALKDLIPTTPPRDDDDNEIIRAPFTLKNDGVECLAKAGDCAGAWALAEEMRRRTDYFKYNPPEYRKMYTIDAQFSTEAMRLNFESRHRACAGKL